MRLARVALSLGSALLAASPGTAQTLQSFDDLALRVNLGDGLRVEDGAGARTTGRLTGLTREEITIATGEGERRFTGAAVREVAVRRTPRRKGVIVGAGVGAVLGALAACTGTERSECADGPIVLAALGAALGGLGSGLFARTTPVYRPADGAPGEPSRPTGPLDELALRVDLGDRVRVQARSGARSTGRIVSLDGRQMVLSTDAGEERFTSATVGEVGARGYSSGRGALIGAAAFAALAVAMPACRSNSDCNPLAAAAVGAGAGAAVGALVPRMTTVFRAQEVRASVSPLLVRGGAGLAGTLRW